LKARLVSGLGICSGSADSNGWFVGVDREGYRFLGGVLRRRRRCGIGLEFPWWWEILVSFSGFEGVGRSFRLVVGGVW
jgi:hypothetical protein